MPALTKLETAVKTAVIVNHKTEMEVQELMYNEFKIPFGELKEKFLDIGKKVGFILSKEQKEKLVKTHLKSLATLPTGYLGALEIINQLSDKNQISPQDTLDLATIGTVADQVPLTNFNRSIVKFGLISLANTKRVGLLELFSQAKFDPHEIKTHQINFIIAPRINAMGRLAHGLDSLRLLCTLCYNKVENSPSSSRRGNFLLSSAVNSMLMCRRSQPGELPLPARHQSVGILSDDTGFNDDTFTGHQRHIEYARTHSME